jgi:lipoyl-dependent peroxiredoxin
MSLKILFTTISTATGGRNGHSESSDGSVSVNLSVPKEMGGEGKPNTTTPEHLFATGYAACFSGALDVVAKKKKMDVTNAIVTCSVSIGLRSEGGYGLAAKIHVKTQGISEADAKNLVDETHLICPYSNVTRNNIQVDLEVEAV